MNIIVKINNQEIVLKQSTFPAGERYLKIESDSLELIKRTLIEVEDIPNINVILLSASSDAIMDCILFSNALEMHFTRSTYFLTLQASYLPYSRQDRPCLPGESFSLKVFLDIVKPYFNKIETIDVHNPDVLENLRYFGNTNVRNTPISYNSSKFINVYGSYNDLRDIPQDSTYFVAVDKGSIARVERAQSELFNRNKIIYFDKVRKDGKIQSILKNDEQITLIEKADKIIIIDDICDGGGTFIKNAEQLVKYNHSVELILVISHGIFSAGFSLIDNYFDSILVLDNDYNKNRLKMYDF